MPGEDRPAWLPEGWTMFSQTRRNRRSKDRYYTCPLTGYTFRSKVEVMRHLSTAKDDGHAPELASHEEANKQASDKEDKKQALHEKDNQQQLAGQVVNSFEWLPSGWILENKIRTKGASTGKKYKCYVDPFTGTRFYSKGQVIRHLEAHKHGSSSYAQRTRAANNSSDLVQSPSDQKRSMKVNLAINNCASTYNRKSINTKSINNVRSTFEYSPNGLPHGWIKEVRIRKNKRTIRKDLFYIDPVRGYVFRSKRGVFRYIETGEISKNASRQNKRHVSEVYSSNKESTPSPYDSRGRSHMRRSTTSGHPYRGRQQTVKSEDGSGSDKDDSDSTEEQTSARDTPHQTPPHTTVPEPSPEPASTSEPSRTSLDDVLAVVQNLSVRIDQNYADLNRRLDRQDDSFRYMFHMHGRLYPPPSDFPPPQ